MSGRPSRWQVIAALCLYAAIFSAFLLGRSVEEENFKRVFSEDGIVENIGAAALLVAAVSFVITWRRGLSNNKAKLLISRYEMARFFFFITLFVAFGEEISWGQRIFGWKTPDIIADVNVQGETNLHNLVWFSQHVSDTFINRLLYLNPATIFSAFCMFAGVFLPLLSKLSLKFARYCEDLNIPVPPLWLGAGFLVNVVAFHLIKANQADPVGSNLGEIKETLYGVVWAMIAIADVLKRTGYIEQPRSTGPK